jgi:2-C-methyl-D-erythritol 4-phosphate cytidylyltransferase
MNSEVPKQFHILAGLPVIMHSIRAFASFDPEIQIIVALPENYYSYWIDQCEQFGFVTAHTLSKGGESRFQTVKNALAMINENSIVAIHDAVRPLVSQKTIETGYRDALTFGNAIPSIPVSESIRWTDGKKNQPVDREKLRMIQTPQVFDINLIRRAYQRVNSDDFTDDASVLEAMGEPIHLFEGNRENIKITHPGELVIAGALFSLSTQNQENSPPAR